MQSPHRLGLWLAVAVLGFIVLQAVTFAAWGLIQYPAEIQLLGLSLVLVGTVVVGCSYMVKALWAGQAAFRWFGFVSLALLGAILIGLAHWQTTLDWPKAESAEARAELKASAKDEQPWVTAWGVLNIAVGTVLLLPPVGSYLKMRRQTTALKS